MGNSNVVEIRPDTLFYTESNGRITGVGDSSSGFEIGECNGITILYTGAGGCIEPEKFKELAVAWLALKYPEVLAIDPT